MKKSDISLTVLGGGQEIGANSYLLEWGDCNIILDAGLNPTSIGYGALPSLDILHGKQIHAIIISHAHLDHIGSLPILFTNYLELGANVFMTKPNVELIPVMLTESAKVVERERIPEKEQYYYHQLFDRDVIKHMKKYFSAHEYDIPFEVCPGISASFFQAGHILGSAGVVLSDGEYTFVYTGDICLRDQTIHGGCRLPDFNNIDALLIESTHGSNSIDDHFDHQAEHLRFAGEIKNTIERGGHTLIPCFGLGRTQDMIATLFFMKQGGLIDRKTPVYYHFGVTSNVNRVYDGFPSWLKNMDKIKIESLSKGLNCYKDDGTFGSVVELYKEPSIFIFTSGMMSRLTPSAHAASELVQSEKHGVFFVGYAAPGELGFELSNITPGQWICVDIDRQKWVQAICPHIHKYAFSAHAYKDELISVASHFDPGIAIWVHGDYASTMRLSREYGETRPGVSSIAPSNRDTIILRTGSKKTHLPLSRCRAVIVTVGTSMITNFIKHAGKSFSGGYWDVTEDMLREFVIKNLNNVPMLSAETNCLGKVAMSSSDFLYFVCGDSPEGFLCGNFLRQIYEDSYMCRVIKINGLRPKDKAFRDEGIKNLIEEVTAIIERHSGNAIIHATGGFKAQIALATLLGILFHNEVYYMFENFDDIIRLPQIPLDFDYRPFLAFKESFFRLIDGREYWNVDEVYEKMPEMMRSCFYKDNIQKKFSLTPLGRGVYSSIQRHLEKKSDVVIFEVKGESSLWGEERDSLSKILNPVIGIVMERLNNFSELLRGYEFSSIGIDGRPENYFEGENYFEFIKKTNDSIVYMIHHTACRKTMQDILTVYTLPGTSEHVLKLFGKKIYP